MVSPRFVVAAIVAAGLLCPRVAVAASTTVSPTTSYDGAYTVSWSAYSGVATTAYLASSTDGVTWSKTAVSKSGGSRAFTGKPLGTYRYKVELWLKEYETGAQYLVDTTNTATVVVSTPPAPGAITGPTTRPYPGAYTLSWGMSAGSVTRYELLENGAATPVYSGLALSTSFTNRAVGAYAYRVRACSALGCGPFTADFVVQVLQTPPAPTPISAPANNASGTFDVTWTRPNGYPVTGYLLERKVGTAAWTSTSLGLVEKFTETSATDGTYQYRVSAVNSGVTGSPTPIVTVAVELRLTETVPDASVTAPSVPETQWVGAVAGQPSADGGAAEYRIPIEVPPGRGGMQPDIALAYSSRGGNGVAGVGWSLSATSSIYRCPRTLAQDGASRPVRLDQEDRLCMDGQRLVLVAGLHGRVGSEYRTEIDPFDRITLTGADISDGRFSVFKVERKSGRVAHFVSWDWDWTNGIPPRSWSITREFDPQGNCVSYQYSPFVTGGVSRESVLTKITYTGSRSGDECVTGPAERSVELQYNAGREDARTTYSAGGVSQTWARLGAIVTKVGASAVRRYELSYKTSAATSRSLLQSVKLCAGATCGAAQLPPTTFEYEEAKASFSWLRAYTDGQGHFTQAAPPGPAGWGQLGEGWATDVAEDYDGDGVRDMIYKQITPEAGWVRTLVLSSCGASTPLDGPQWTGGSAWVGDPLQTWRWRATIDFNSDGRTDVIGAKVKEGVAYLAFASAKCVPTPAGGWAVSWSTIQETNLALTGYFDPNVPTKPSSSFAYAWDCEGDGRIDVGYYDAVAARWKAFSNRGRDPDGAIVWEETNACVAVAGPPPDGGDKLVQKFRADLNGDGLDDVYYGPLTDGLQIEGLNLEPAIAFGSAPGQVPAPAMHLSQLGSPVGLRGGRWMDVNGDGLRDIYTPGAVWINRGGPPRSGMFVLHTVAALNDPYHRADKAMTMDVDADGRDELLVPRDRTIWYCADDPSPPPEPQGACGDELDGTLNEGKDHSVYLWDVYRFVERPAPASPFVTFDLVKIPIVDELQAPVRYSATKVEDYFGDGQTDVGFELVDEYRYSPIYGRVVWLGHYMTNPEGLGPYVARNVAPAPDLLKRVVNGVGAEARWAHQPLSRPVSECDPAITPGNPPSPPFYVAHNEDTSRAPGYVFFTSSMWTVTSFDVSNGVGAATNRTCYRYEDAMLHMEGRGFQGFKKIVAEERLPPAAGEVAGVAGSCGAGGCSANNLRTTTEFNQEFPLTNRVKRVLVERASDGHALSETRKWWYAATSGQSFVVYPSATIEKRYDLATSATLATTSSVQDLFDVTAGEARRTCTITEDETWPDVDVRRRSVAQEDRMFESDTGAVWWPARLVSSTVTSDFASSPFPDPPMLPAACPALPRTADAKVRGARYTWFAASAAQGAQRKLESEAVYAGAPPPTAESPACFPWPTSAEARTCLAYDARGNVASRSVRARDVLDAANNPKTLVTTYATSSDGYFTRTETNPAQHVATTETDPATGQPTYRQAVQGGPATTMQYDGLGRPLTTTTDGAKPVFERRLSCATNLPALLEPLPACAAGEVLARAVYQAGAPTRAEYLDVLGRVVRTASVGFDGAFVVQSDVRYNARGASVSEYAPYSLLAGPVTRFETRYSGLDAQGRVGRREVDRNAGMFASGKGEATLATDYVHERFTTSITVHRPATQGGELKMSRTYDARGKLVETTQRVAGDGSNDAIAQYLYDPTGALTNIRSGSCNPSRTSCPVNPSAVDLVATYDNLGRKVEVRDPDRGRWVYTWDGLGRLRTQTDARGNVTAQDYDGIGRPVQRKTTNGAAAPIIANWTWDLAAKSVLDRLDGNDGYSRVFKYDPLLRPYKVTTTVPQLDVGGSGTRTFVMEYGYDAGTGWLKAKRYPGTNTRETVVLDYDARGYPLGESEWLSSGARGKRYRHVAGMDARGHVTLQDFGNAVAESATYDGSTGQMLGTQATRSDGSLIRAVAYRYDHFLNLAWQEKTLPPGAPTKVTETFTYDDLQRIRSASRVWVGLPGETPATDTYTYDDLGNLLSKSDYATVYGYGSSARTTRNAGPHAVAQVTKAASAGGGTATFTYDLNGNLVEGDGRAITFDLMDRPARVCSGTPAACATGAAAPGATSDFSYGPEGARYRQVISGGVDTKFGPKTVYYVDKDYELTVESGGVEERTYVGGSVVVYRTGATREVRYLHLDRLGSVDALTRDVAGALEFSADAHGFDPWGKPRGGGWISSSARLHPAGDRITQAVTTTRGFTGHEHLDAHYLIHMNGRAYDYRLGRFLSVDPIISEPGNAQAVNPYSYIGNNPLSGVDPTGYAANFDDQKTTANEKLHGSVHQRRMEGSVLRPGSPGTVNGNDVDSGAGRAILNPARNGAEGQSNSPKTGATTDKEAPSQRAKQGVIDTAAQVAKDSFVGTAKELANGLIGVSNAINAPLDAVLSGVTDFRFGRFPEFEGATAGEKSAMAGVLVVSLASGTGEARLAGRVALDTNAIIARLERGAAEMQAVVQAMAGRAPSVSMTAVKEFLRGGGDINALRGFLAESGGTVGRAASAPALRELTRTGLKPGDARVVGSAMREGIPLLTRDKEILRKAPTVAGGF